MGFFGAQVTAEGEVLQVEIQPDMVLNVTNVSSGTAAGDLQVATTDTGFLTICNLEDKGQWATNLKFAFEDSPVEFRAQGDGSSFAVTGFWEQVAEEDDEEWDEEDEDALEEALQKMIAEGAQKRKRSRDEAEGEAGAEGNGAATEEEVTLTPEEEERKAKRAAKKARRAARDEERRAIAAAFAQAEKEDSAAREAAEEAAGVGRRVAKPKDRVLKGNLRVMDRIIGNGKPVRKGKQVRLTYEGFLKKEDGRMFDSNMNRGRPFKFRMGTREVIEGLDRGVEGMKVGGVRRITVPAALGYGAKGTKDGMIPPNSTLVFVVEIVGAQQ
uniref:peptidylprolyl isomerase n=1 Tax=Phaeomonas parva TaxID=124430 RepID=A0A7S1UBD1_9STRA